MAKEIRPVTGKDGKLYYNDPVDYYDSTDSGADAALLSQKDLQRMDELRGQWYEAQKAGDQATMDKLHAEGERIRAGYGYQGGANGGAYNVLWRDPDENLVPASGSSGTGSYAHSDTASRASYPKSDTASAGARFTYQDAPAYVNRYQDQIDALSQQILGREAFSYNPEKDPTYQQYRDSYTRSGQRAMQDTLGQVSARTGGLASSYAGSAAQQTYDGYMSALADKIPELKQLAYQMYLDEGNTQRANLSMLTALEQGDYAKYQGLLAQYNTDRSFAYGQHRDSIGDQRYDQEFNYQVGRDALSDQRYDQEFNYQVGRDALSDRRYDDETAYNRGIYADETAYDRAVYADERDYNRGVYADETAYNRGLARAKLLAETGDFSGYQALGYSDEEVQRMQAAFLLQHPEYAALYQTNDGMGMGSALGVDSMGNTIYYNNGVGTYSDGTPYYGAASFTGGTSSSGSGVSGGSSDGSTWNKWADVEDWVAKYGEKSAENYLKEHYKEFGYRSQSTAIAGWKNHLVETGGSTAGSTGASGSAGSGSTGSYYGSGTSSASGASAAKSSQQTITSASQLGKTALNIINHINPDPNYVATQIQKGRKNGTVTEAEAEFLLRSIGY